MDKNSREVNAVIESTEKKTCAQERNRAGQPDMMAPNHSGHNTGPTQTVGVPNRDSEKDASLTAQAPGSADDSMHDIDDGTGSASAGADVSASSQIGDDDDCDTLPYIDPEYLRPTVYKKEDLKHCSKPQLIDLCVKTSTRLATVSQTLANYQERIARDAMFRFVETKDIKTLPVIEQSATSSGQGDTSTNEDGDGTNHVNGDTTPVKTPSLGRKSNPKKQPGSRQKRIGQMPVHEDVIELPDDKLGEMYEGTPRYLFINYVEIEEVQKVPATLYLQRYKVAKYLDKKTNKIVQVKLAKELKSHVGSDLSNAVLAYIANEYYNNCCPVNRLCEKLALENTPLYKQTIYTSLRKYGDSFIQPIVCRLLQLLLNSPAIQSDETYWRCLEDMLFLGKKMDYYWLLRTSEKLTTEHQIIIFSFVKHRSLEELKKLLGDYNGTIECDGYGVYPALEKAIASIVIACCLNHVRHKFSDAVKVIRNFNKMTEEKKLEIPAYQIVVKIDEIFREESNLKESSREDRLKKRIDVICPLLDELFTVIEKHASSGKFDPQSMMGKALTYAINRKPYILLGAQNPDIPLHNLASERCFIRLSLFRNNSKSFTTFNGGVTGGYYFSVAATCRECNINPEIYYRYLFDNMEGIMASHEDDIAKGDYSFLDDHLPWTENVRMFAAKCQEETNRVISNLQVGVA